MAQQLKDLLSVMRTAQRGEEAVTALQQVAEPIGGLAFKAKIVELHQRLLEEAALPQHSMTPVRVETNLARLMASAYACDALQSSIAAQRTQLANLQISLNAETIGKELTHHAKVPIESGKATQTPPEYRGACESELQLRAKAHDDANTALEEAKKYQRSIIGMGDDGLRVYFGGGQESAFGQHARVLAEVENDHPMNEGRRNAAKAIMIRDMKLGEIAIAVQKDAAYSALSSMQAEREFNGRSADALKSALLMNQAKHEQHVFAASELSKLKENLEIEEELAAAVVRLFQEAQLAHRLAKVFAKGLEEAYGKAVPDLVKRWDVHLSTAAPGYEDPADIERLLALLSLTDSALRDMLAHAKGGCEPITVQLRKTSEWGYSAEISGEEFDFPKLTRMRGLSAATFSHSPVKVKVEGEWPDDDTIDLIDAVVGDAKTTLMVPQATAEMWNRPPPQQLSVTARLLDVSSGEQPDELSLLLCAYYVVLPGAPKK